MKRHSRRISNRPRDGNNENMCVFLHFLNALSRRHRNVVVEKIDQLDMETVSR